MAQDGDRLRRPPRLNATKTKPMCVAEWRDWLEFRADDQIVTPMRREINHLLGFGDGLKLGRVWLRSQLAFRFSSRTTRRRVISSSSLARCSRRAWLMAVW